MIQNIVQNYFIQMYTRKLLKVLTSLQGHTLAHACKDIHSGRVPISPYK